MSKPISKISMSAIKLVKYSPTLSKKKGYFSSRKKYGIHHFLIHLRAEIFNHLHLNFEHENHNISQVSVVKIISEAPNKMTLGWLIRDFDEQFSNSFDVVNKNGIRWVRRDKPLLKKTLFSWYESFFQDLPKSIIEEIIKLGYSQQEIKEIIEKKSTLDNIKQLEKRKSYTISSYQKKDGAEEKLDQQIAEMKELNNKCEKIITELKENNPEIFQYYYTITIPKTINRQFLLYPEEDEKIKVKLGLYQETPDKTHLIIFQNPNLE